MTLPNDSINVTPGVGEVVATHIIGGKEYQVVILAGPSGHLTDSLDTHLAYADNVAFAGNKYHVSILNASGSGKIVKCHKIFAINLQVAGVTGVMVRFDVFKIIAHSGGTIVTPEKLDTIVDNLPAGITVRTGATSVTLGNKLFGLAITNEEIGATGQLITGTHVLQGLNLLFESPRIQELTLREGEGFAIRQITTSTVGSYGWILIFTVE